MQIQLSWKPLTTADFLTNVRYASVASVIRQSDELRRSKRNPGPSISIATARTDNSSGKNGRSGGSKCSGKKMTAAEPANAKLTQSCRTCGKGGNWADKHKSDTSLEPKTPSPDPHASASSGNINQRNQSGANNDGNNKGLGSQNKLHLIGFTANVTLDKNQLRQPSDTLIFVSSVPTRSFSIGTIADDGAPYRAISEVKIGYHQKRLVGQQILFEQKPEKTKGVTSGSLALVIKQVLVVEFGV